MGSCLPDPCKQTRASSMPATQNHIVAPALPRSPSFGDWSCCCAGIIPGGAGFAYDDHSVAVAEDPSDHARDTRQIAQCEQLRGFFVRCVVVVCRYYNRRMPADCTAVTLHEHGMHLVAVHGRSATEQMAVLGVCRWLFWL